MSAPRLCLILATAALLASCGGEQSGEGDARSSSGEVLEGTISDAMLPLDTVRSQPPLVPRAPAPGATSTEAADEDAAEDAEADVATEPEAGPTSAGGSADDAADQAASEEAP